MKTPTDNGAADPGEKKFRKDAQAYFAASVERIDAATLSKLNQARQVALAEVSARSQTRKWRQWMPAAGIAAAAAIAVLMLQGPGNTTLPDASEALADDFEILLGGDDLDMFEDLEFYSWIELADSSTSDNVG